ncbi:MAG TPA: AraC family transcriptional regulator, partial [Holophagaceae bacterium]|nr:AraC family transcriptional regulator [Holophagaceae bacterium]
MPPRRAPGLDALLSQLGSLAFVEELFDRVHEAVFTVKDPKGRYLAMSRSGVERCGLASKEAALGRTAQELWPPEMAARYAEQDARLFRTGRPIVDALDLTLYPDRRPGWCLTQKVPLRDRSGRVVALACLSTDLPEPSRAGLIDAPFAAAVDHIHAHFAEGLRVEPLAALAGVSLSQFERRMKKVFHLSPGQYVMKVRIQAAAEALAGTTRPIAAIADEVGFCDQAALSRHFKQVTGLSPAAYRRWVGGE